MPPRVQNLYLHAAAHAKYGAIPLDEMRGKFETAADAKAMRRLIDRYMLVRDPPGGAVFLGYPQRCRTARPGRRGAAY